MDGVPTAVLTNQMQALLSGRRVKSAVFTSFTLEPQFFEEEILTLLAGDDLIQEPKLRVVQMQELLGGAIGPITVYYDQSGLRPEGTPKLDVRYVPVRVRTGLFHPKVILLLTESKEESIGSGSTLICGVLSANLAKRAWWETLECAHFEVVEQDSMCSFRDELLDCMKAIRGLGGREPDHTALDLIRKWLQKSTDQSQHATENGRLRTRLIAGTRAFLDSVDDLRGDVLDGCSLEVISPFFDKDDPKPLKALVEKFGVRETRVFLPTASDGSALCSGDLFKSVVAMDSTHWGKLPEDLLKVGKEKNAVRRGVHAKVYRFTKRSSRYEALIVGSHNLTSQAHQRGGNFEASFFLEREPAGPIEWWLAVEGRRPTEFDSDTDGEEEATEVVVPLQLSFDWVTKVGETRWDGASMSPALRVQSAGAPLFELSGIINGEWRALPPSASQELERVLVSTSILEVLRPDGKRGSVLVQEMGMTRKPSTRLRFSAADILEYWSRLSPAQRADYLASLGGNIPEAFVDTPQQTGKRESESFFATYAGIFHGFEMLRKQVAECLQDDRHRQADQLLFGHRHDSLPSLMDRVVDGGDGMDRVSRYLVLLCVKQLLREMKERDEPFFATRELDIKALLARTAEASPLAAALDLGAGGADFLDWFEKHFAKSLRLNTEDVDE